MIDEELAKVWELLRRDGDDPECLEPIVARYRVSAAEAAHRGDKNELLELYAQEKPLNAEERKIVISCIAGSFSPKRGRPEDFELTRKVAVLMWWKTEADEIPVEAAAAEIGSLLGLSRSTIYSRQKAGRASREVQADLAGRKAMLKFCCPETISKFRAIDEISE